MKPAELILGGSLLFQGCAQPPEYFEDLSQAQYNDAEQGLVEVDNVLPFVSEAATKSPVLLVDAHGKFHDDQNNQAIKDLELAVENSWDFLKEGRMFSYDKNNVPVKKDEVAPDGQNHRNVGKGIENDYFGIDHREFRDYRGPDKHSPGRLREILVHEPFHSMALTADNHSNVIEHPEKYFDLKEIDMLELSIQEGDPGYQGGLLVLCGYVALYGEIGTLYHQRDSALQRYNEDPWSPENPDSWNDPQSVYNSVSGSKKDESELREIVRKDIEKAILLEVLEISQKDREAMAKKWLSSDNWDKFLEDYEYHYNFILDEITNEFEDYEIMTLEERAEREEKADHAREARERRVADLDGYRKINPRKLR